MEVFATITEPRRVTRGNFKHQLQDILLLVFSAVLCGANDWNEIEDFGWDQLEWLKTIGNFTNKVPSHDTINRVFSAINSDEFSSCFSQWVLKTKQVTKREVIAIDGKRI